MKESEIRNSQIFNQYLSMVGGEVIEYFKNNNTNFQEISCISCNSNKYSVQFKKNCFRYVLCDNCGTLYANPRPSSKDLLDFYTLSKSAQFWIDSLFFPSIEVRRENIFKPRAKYVIGKILKEKLKVIGDIGAGFGLFLEEMRKLHPEIHAVAIEPSIQMANICKEKKLEVICKPIEEIDDKNENFDFLSAFELIEHLHDPQILFKKVHAMLRPKGFFLISTLNCEGFDIQILWQKSKNIYPPHHINFFNPTSIRHIFESNDFCIEELNTTGKLDWNIVENAIIYDGVKVDRFWHNFSKNATQTAKDEFQLFLSKNGFSSHMMVLARKK